MYDLNEKVNTISVFNNGVAGKVENVSISVEKKGMGGNDQAPLYKLIINDGSGAAPLTPGFCFNNWEQEDKSRQDMTYTRVKSIADAVVPEGFVYPTHDGTYVAAIHTLFKVIKENCEDKKVDVFTSYGYIDKNKIPHPSKYLGLRMFNFIQSKNPKYDILKPSNADILERPEADAPKADAVGTQAKTSGDIW